jgi:hypothetical protein
MKNKRTNKYKPVHLHLTSQQVSKVVREACGGGASLSVLLAGPVSCVEILPFPVWEKRYREDTNGSRFSVSLLKGLVVFACLLRGEPVSVSDLAARLQTGTSTAYRYLNTLLILELIEQDPKPTSIG